MRSQCPITVNQYVGVTTQISAVLLLILESFHVRFVLFEILISHIRSIFSYLRTRRVNENKL